MSKTHQRIFALDIRNAELEGIKKLLENWNKEHWADHAQAQWKAIVERLRNDVLLATFRSQSGIATTTTNAWSCGDSLPSGKMCSVYITLIIEIIGNELEEIATQRQKLRESPKAREPKAEPSLPEQVIVDFQMPETLSSDTDITELDGYQRLSTRLKDCLKNNNIVRAADLLKPDRGTDTWQFSLLSMPNFGRKSLGELYQFMLNNGYVPTLAK